MEAIENIERIERKWSLHNCTKAQFHIAISSKFLLKNTKPEKLIQFILMI